MADKRICLGCEIDDDSSHMFKVVVLSDDLGNTEEEIYCNECLANVLTEEPEVIVSMEAI